jgi:ankyrin repeat protein
MTGVLVWSAVQLLLDYNASVTARTTVARNSVMHFAAKNGSEEVIKILMEKDAMLLDAPNKNLDTPLMMAVLARNHMAARCVIIAYGRVSMLSPTYCRWPLVMRIK